MHRLFVSRPVLCPAFSAVLESQTCSSRPRLPPPTPATCGMRHQHWWSTATEQHQAQPLPRWETQALPWRCVAGRHQPFRRQGFERSTTPAPALLVDTGPARYKGHFQPADRRRWQRDEAGDHGPCGGSMSPPSPSPQHARRTLLTNSCLRPSASRKS